MSKQDRIRWDDIFKKRINEDFPNTDALLLDYAPRAEADEDNPLRALDLASGLGQNGIWLAEQGYNVDMMDISRVALQRTRAELTMRNVRNVNLLQVDIDKLVLRWNGDCDMPNELCPDTYDLIIVFRYLRRPLFPILMAAIKSGGRIIYETYNQRYLQYVPAFNNDFLLKDGELLAAFDDWRVIHHDEATHVSQLVAVKP